jgi:hypothetical protein
VAYPVVKQYIMARAYVGKNDHISNWSRENRQDSTIPLKGIFPMN